MKSWGRMAKKDKKAGNKPGQQLSPAESNRAAAEQTAKQPSKSKSTIAFERRKNRVDGIIKTVYPSVLGTAAGFACYHPPIELLTDENVRDCKEHGVKMNVWTVNDMAGLEQLHRWGCEGIITNFPGVASGWLRAQGE